MAAPPAWLYLIPVNNRLRPSTFSSWLSLFLSTLRSFSASSLLLRLPIFNRNPLPYTLNMMIRRLPASLLVFVLTAPLAFARSHADTPADPHAASARHAAARTAKEILPPPSAYNDHPKLAIILVIDQFRG